MSDDRPQSLASGTDSIAHHVSELLPLPVDQRDRYLGALDDATAEELRELLAFESSAVDLSELAGVTVAQELMRREVPPQLGRWRVQRPLGQGGMGSVYLVTREELGIVHEGAAKLGHSQIQSAAALAAIQREAGALSVLQHGNIARLLDFGADERGLPFVVSEYVEGTALLTYLNGHRLDRNRRIELFDQLLDAVIAAHANLVLHLDLKPDNVLVTASGQVKLIDFGLSGLGGEKPAGFTQAFASPEQLAGQPVTVAADIFALGKILELIVSCAPSVGGAELAAIVKMATHDDPAERYPSALALKLDIQALQSRRPVTPLAQRRLYRWSRFLRRQWLPTSLSVLIVAVLVTGLLSVYRQNHAIEQERDRALELLASERATSSFVTQSLREASVFAGGDGQMTVAELMHSMLENLPAEEDMSPRSKSWLASDLAAVFTGLGEMDAALAASEMAVAAAERSEELEDDIAHWTQRALTAGVAHRYELALEAAETARSLALSVNHWRLPWTYLATMQTLVAMKRWSEVVELFDVIQALPTDRQSVRGNIHYMRGIALTGLERFDVAAADFAAAGDIYGEVFGADSAPIADVQFRDYQRLIQQGELEQASRRTAALDKFFADSYGPA
ncbi:MAG: serine/threonine-protein kinase, partial [Pseudomonadota bacterium]